MLETVSVVRVWESSNFPIFSIYSENGSGN